MGIKWIVFILVIRTLSDIYKTLGCASGFISANCTPADVLNSTSNANLDATSHTNTNERDRLYNLSYLLSLIYYH